MRRMCRAPYGAWRPSVHGSRLFWSPEQQSGCVLTPSPSGSKGENAVLPTLEYLSLSQLRPYRMPLVPECMSWER